MLCSVLRLEMPSSIGSDGSYFRERMYVLYDDSCQLCRRTVAVLLVFDIFGRVTYLNTLDRETIKGHGLDRLRRYCSHD